MNARLRGRLLALVAVAALVASLLRLFEYRFSAGDIFPPGSSRRADPLGTKALYEGLELLPGVRVSRNLERLASLGEPTGTTLLVLGVTPEAIGTPMGTPERDLALDQFVRQGGQLILAVEHQNAESATNVWRSGYQRLGAGLNYATNSILPLPARLGFALTHTNLSGERAHRLAPDSTLPDSLPWPSQWHFTQLSPDWQSLYARGGEAVVARRAHGSGQVILLASDYLFLNDALRRHREPAFLAGLLGPNRRIVFDETHLGLSLEPGVASLVRKYHLGGAVLGLWVLAGLYVWRQTVRFNPPPPDPAAEVVIGRNTERGLLNVLRRGVPPDQLGDLAFQEWRRSLGRHHRVPESRLADAQEQVNLENALPPGQRRPADLHQRLARLLHPRAR
jgi:hypothetical protein